MKKLFTSPPLAVLRFALSLFICLMIICGVNSCKKELNKKAAGDPHGIGVNPNGQYQVAAKKITFQAFLDSTKNVASGNLNKLMLNAADGQLKVNDAGSNSSLVLFVDSVRQINKSGHSSYTFPVKQASPYDVSFRNLVIDVYNNAATAHLITYTPDTTYIKNFIKGKKGKFSGKVHLALFDLYGSNSGSLQVSATQFKTNQQQMCFPIDVYLGSSYVLCTGTDENGAPAGHSPTEWCECGITVPCQRAYRVDVYVTANICYDIDIPPTGGGGGGGGGGGTPPTTPPDYDPCPPINVASNGLKVQFAEGEPPCIPPVLPPVVPPPYVSVVNNFVQDPCLSAIVNRMTGPNTYKIDEILWNTFGPNERINYTVIDGTNLPNTRMGETTPTPTLTYSGSRAVYTYTTTLNRNVLQNAAKEFTAVTIVHEALHAIFQVNGINVNNAILQHTSMANDYIDDIRNLVKSAYPSVNDKDINAMILYEFPDLMTGNPQLFESFTLQNYQLSIADIINIGNDYKNGNKGSKCP